MECCCYFRNIQDKLAGRKSPYDKQMALCFVVQFLPFGANLHETQKGRLHQLGTEMLPEQTSDTVDADALWTH